LDFDTPFRQPLDLLSAFFFFIDHKHRPHEGDKLQHYHHEFMTITPSLLSRPFASTIPVVSSLTRALSHAKADKNKHNSMFNQPHQSFRMGDRVVSLWHSGFPLSDERVWEDRDGFGCAAAATARLRGKNTALGDVFWGVIGHRP
jgi:hypothetical protein